MNNKRIDRMTNSELLQEYASYQRWFGDDFCMFLPEEKDHRRSGKIQVEILKRMGTFKETYSDDCEYDAKSRKTCQQQCKKK